MTIDELVEEWKSEDNILAASAEGKSPISASLMNTLMEPSRSLPYVPHRSCSYEHSVIATSRDKSKSKHANDRGTVAGRRISCGRSARTSSTTSRETNVSALSTSSCTSLELSLSNDSLSSLLDNDAEGEKDDEALLSPDSLWVDDTSTPASLRHQSGSLRSKRISTAKKESLSPPAMEFVENHPLLDCSGISSLGIAADLKTANVGDGTDCKVTRATNIVNTVASASSSPAIRTSPPTKRISPVANDVRNVSTIDPPQSSNSPSSLTAFTASFKSNLTASLNALASAARSFSNFTAPSLPPDDLLTRSLLAPNPSSVRYQPLNYPPARFPSEMRPKPIHGVPEPALRRYLNPGMGMTLTSPSLPSKVFGTGTLREAQERRRKAKEVSRAGAKIPEAVPARALPADLPSRQEFVRQVQQLGNVDGEQSARRKDDRFNAEKVSFIDYENCEDMIPLEPFSRSVPKPNTVAHSSQSHRQRQRQQQQQQQQQLLPSPPFSALQNHSCAHRPREPRENSDFLRIVVLEMNMRRTGKLDADATGKARIWLPPRREREICDSSVLLGQNDKGIDEVVSPDGLGGPNGPSGSSGAECAEGESKTMTIIPRRWIGQVPSAAAATTAAAASSFSSFTTSIVS